MIWLRALSFVVAVQLTVIGVVPWLLGGVGPRIPMSLWHLVGIVPLVTGGLALLWCNWAFVVQGRGTAAPYDPPRALVAQGLYRYVRNPMYISAVLIVLGIGLWTGVASLFGYALLWRSAIISSCATTRSRVCSVSSERHMRTTVLPCHAGGRG